MNRFYADGCLVIDRDDNLIVRYLNTEQDAILCAFIMNVM